MLRAALALVVAVGAVVAASGPALADDPPPVVGGRGTPDPSQPTASTSSPGGGSVAVTVTSSYSTPGHGPTSHSTTTTTVSPLCWYRQGQTGFDFYEYWKDGGEALESRTLYDFRAQGLLPAGWDSEKISTDKEGHWYDSMCSIKAPGDFQDAYYKSHPAIFVEANEQPPAAAAAVDPHVLLEAMTKVMEIPRGEISTNPSLEGSGATLVGVPTWVWLEGAPTTLTMTATIPSGAFAEVDAKLSEVLVTADGANDTRCDGPGVPWTATADQAGGGACTITFLRSSANQTPHTSTLTVSARWTGTWFSSMNRQPVPLDQPLEPVVSTEEIPVAESESIVTG